jgi:uncharacterized protein GlcG (DUF336 family)
MSLEIAKKAMVAAEAEAMIHKWPVAIAILDPPDPSSCFRS